MHDQESQFSNPHVVFYALRRNPTTVAKRSDNCCKPSNCVCQSDLLSWWWFCCGSPSTTYCCCSIASCGCRLGYDLLSLMSGNFHFFPSFISKHKANIAIFRRLPEWRGRVQSVSFFIHNLMLSHGSTECLLGILVSGSYRDLVVLAFARWRYNLGNIGMHLSFRQIALSSVFPELRTFGAEEERPASTTKPALGFVDHLFSSREVGERDMISSSKSEK